MKPRPGRASVSRSLPTWSSYTADRLRSVRLHTAACAQRCVFQRDSRISDNAGLPAVALSRRRGFGRSRMNLIRLSSIALVMLGTAPVFADGHFKILEPASRITED